MLPDTATRRWMHVTDEMHANTTDKGHVWHTLLWTWVYSIHIEQPTTSRRNALGCTAGSTGMYQFYTILNSNNKDIWHTRAAEYMRAHRGVMLLLWRGGSYLQQLATVTSTRIRTASNWTCVGH